MAASITETMSRWVRGLQFDDLPDDVLRSTEARILDVAGLVLVARRFEVGKAILAGAGRLGGPAEAHILGERALTGAATAALVNGALAEAIEYDDTHNESVVHVGAAIVAAALAGAEAADASGPELIMAVAAGAEVTCRLAMIASGAFHPRGFHPTGIFCPFGAIYAAGMALDLPEAVLTHAAGVAGSQAAGLLECWADGTSTKTIHPGWAAHSAIIALQLAEAGLTGPARVIEGRAGVIAAHVQNPAGPIAFDGACADLGVKWESRGISFKPYPAAHVLHGLIEAAINIRDQVPLGDIDRIICSVATHWTPIICEPESEKRRPPSAAAARISLHHTIAEVLTRGGLTSRSYAPEDLDDPSIQQLADRVEYVAESTWTDRAEFPGRLLIRLRCGREIVGEVAANLGGARRQLTFRQVAEKFRLNAQGTLSDDQAEAACNAVLKLRERMSARHFAGLFQ